MGGCTSPGVCLTSNNFATSATLAEVCAWLSAVLVCIYSCINICTVCEMSKTYTVIFVVSLFDYLKSVSDSRSIDVVSFVTCSAPVGGQAANILRWFGVYIGTYERTNVWLFARFGRNSFTDWVHIFGLWGCWFCYILEQIGSGISEEWKVESVFVTRLHVWVFSLNLYCTRRFELTLNVHLESCYVVDDKIVVNSWRRGKSVVLCTIYCYWRRISRKKYFHKNWIVILIVRLIQYLVSISVHKSLTQYTGNSWYDSVLIWNEINRRTESNRLYYFLVESDHPPNPNLWTAAGGQCGSSVAGRVKHSWCVNIKPRATRSSLPRSL